MTLPSQKPTVVFLPDGVRFSALAEQAVEQVGAVLLPFSRAAEAQIAVVDPDAPGGLDAVERLRREGRDFTLLAIVNWSKQETSERLRDLGVSDLVHADTLAAELPFRLQKAAARHSARRDSAQRERNLQLLLRLTADYAESLDVKELLHDVTKRLASELDILRASMVVLDEHRDVGFVIAASDDAAMREHRIELYRYPEIREVVRTGKPVLVDDVPSHPLLEGVKSQVTARGIHAIAALPLAIRGKVIGVLLLRASSRRRGFSPREMDLLATVAHATATALRNARLLATERDHVAAEKSARIAAEERAADLLRYEAYFANVSEGVAILDDQAMVISLNPAGTQLLDVTAVEARGKHFNQLTNPTDDGLVMDMLWSIQRGEVRREIDLAVKTATGRRLTLSVCAAQMKEGGAASIVSFRDVTVQRRLADELAQTKDFLERLIDSSVDAIIAADMTGKIILFNKGAETICGYAADEVINKLHVRELYGAGVAKEIMGRLRGTGEGGRGRLGVTRQEILAKSGERVPVNMTASILYEGDREFATVGIFTDLRDRMQLERKLSDAETRLEESERNAVIVALAGTAAHELNQPLTSVMGYAELLKRRLKEGDFAYRPVDIIHREAERMAEIVRKIGKITRYETKAYVGQSKILDLDKASSHEE